MEPLSERERAAFGPRPDKPAGSVGWCWQTIFLMQARWKQKTINEAGFQALLDELRAYDAWNVVPSEKPYGTIDAMLLAEIGCTEAEARATLAAQATGSTGGRPAKQESGKLPLSTQKERAVKNGVSPRTQEKLDYLAAHAPTLLAAVQAGAVSTHAAYQEARGIPKETPLTTLHRVWRQVSPEDRLEFLVEMMTPNERRAIQFSLEEEPVT